VSVVGDICMDCACVLAALICGLVTCLVSGVQCIIGGVILMYELLTCSSLTVTWFLFYLLTFYSNTDWQGQSNSAIVVMQNFV